MCRLRNIALESVTCNRRTKWSLCVAMLRRRHKNVLYYTFTKITFSSTNMFLYYHYVENGNSIVILATFSRPFRRPITGLVLNVSFWPDLEHKMAFVYARKDDVAVASFWWRAINKKNILTFMVSGDSMHLLFCVLSIEIGWHID